MKANIQKNAGMETGIPEDHHRAGKRQFSAAELKQFAPELERFDREWQEAERRGLELEGTAAAFPAGYDGEGTWAVAIPAKDVQDRFRADKCRRAKQRRENERNGRKSEQEPHSTGDVWLRAVLLLETNLGERAKEVSAQVIARHVSPQIKIAGRLKQLLDAERGCMDQPQAAALYVADVIQETTLETLGEWKQAALNPLPIAALAGQVAYRMETGARLVFDDLREAQRKENWLRKKQGAGVFAATAAADLQPEGREAGDFQAEWPKQAASVTLSTCALLTIDPLEELLACEGVRLLEEQARAALSPKQWAVFQLCKEEQTGPQIAELLGMAEGTVNTHKHQIKAKLARAWGNPAPQKAA